MTRFAIAAATLLLAGCASATARDEMYRLAAPYNDVFYDTHTAAARSFYAAHYAHFRVYEVALNAGPDAADAFAATERRVRELIVAPPKFEPPAELIAPQWAKIAFPTGRSMDWTHMLHTQLYDILTDDRITDKRAAGERAIAYYLSNGGSAFSTRGYGHRWMLGGGAWAGGFATKYPSMNGILWSYHWHHAAIYEALMESSPAARARELGRVLRIFEDSVLRNPPGTMPLTAEIAPRFARMFPAAAHIFDNLHMMHDVVNDVMVDATLTREEQRAEIERMRRNMLYLGQDVVIAPGMPMGGGAHDHAMSEGGLRVPTQLADGAWLPQGHPEARLATMDELMMPLLPGAAPAAAHTHHEDGGAP